MSEGPPADYIRKTQETYDAYAVTLSKKYEARSEAQEGQIDEFLAILPGKRVLDIGSGPGAQALLLKERGAEVFCGDISPAMAERCRAKGLAAEVVDLTDLSRFGDASFDGIWSYASLLHVKRDTVPVVLAEFARILAGQGGLAIAVQRGEGEEFRMNDPQHPDAGRWFTYFPDGEIEQLAWPHFSLITKGFDPFEATEGDRIATGWSNYLFQKRHA